MLLFAKRVTHVMQHKVVDVIQVLLEQLIMVVVVVVVAVVVDNSIIRVHKIHY